MTIRRKNNPFVRAARVVSVVFSPLMIPTYCTIMAMWLTPLNAVPENTRFVASAVVMALTCLFPLMILFSMMRLGRIKDLDVSDRRQRFRPMLYIFVCYVLATIYMWNISAPLWLVLYYVSGCVTAVLMMLISLRWKISGHGAGMGNMAGMIIAFIEGGYGEYDMLPWLCTIIVLCGVVGTARVILHRHTLAQTYAGTILSAVITAVMMLFPEILNVFK